MTPPDETPDPGLHNDDDKDTDDALHEGIKQDEETNAPKNPEVDFDNPDFTKHR